MSNNKGKKSHGGALVPHRKNTKDLSFVEIPTPAKVIVPMNMNIGAPCSPLVKNGDEVLIGQLIADTDAFVSAPIHAPIAGKVMLTEQATSSGEVVQAITITKSEEQKVADTVSPPTINNYDDFVSAVRASGAVGLGGAGFPTHIKLKPKNLDAIDSLVINGAECEPYITADYRTMLERSDDIIEGIRLVMKYLNIKNAYIGIEGNKPDAIAKLSDMTKNDEGISVIKLRARYPQGAEKILIYETVGRTVPMGGLPSDVGVIVMNVATIAHINSYIKTGMPLIKKGLTVDGSAITNPQNLIAPIGTPIRDLVEFCSGYKKEPRKLIMGGPMMGAAITSDDMPILKNSNAVLAFDARDTFIAEPTACIRCGRCVDACPVSLMPFEFERALARSDIDALTRLSISNCMECGTCSFVCPAKRNLVHSIKLGKKAVREAKK